MPSAEVVSAAVLEPSSATVPSVVPPSENVTVPLVAPPPTVAVKVTDWPYTAEPAEEARDTLAVPWLIAKLAEVDFAT